MVYHIYMNTYEQFKAYIERRIYPDKQKQFISVNRLDFIFAEVNSAAIRLSKIRTRMMEDVLIRITDLLRPADIEPIHFKGISLSRLLYDQPERRVFSDIDFYVDSKDYSKSLDILMKSGFSVQEAFDGHHITLNYQGVSVEMHTAYFHPDDEIAFTVPNGNLQQMAINGHNLTTFDPTYQFLFLFLHYFTHARKGGKYADHMLLIGRYQSDPIIELSRLYDIALLIERYGKEIDWRHCESELSPFRDCAEFACVLSEFSDIFPALLPDEFIENPSVEEKFPIFHRFISEPERYFDNILADITAHDRPFYSCPDAKPDEYRFHVDEYDAQKPHSYVIAGIAPKSSADLSFRFDFWIRDGRLWFELDVTDDVLNYLTEGVFPEDNDAIGYCDSLTLCIASAGERYTFHSIYAFLTQNGEKEKYLSVYDIADSPVSLSGIAESGLALHANGYTARVGIPLEYLSIDKKNPSFYFNVMVSDSDDENGCDTVLALDPLPTAWNDCRTYPIGKAGRLKGCR